MKFIFQQESETAVTELIQIPLFIHSYTCNGLIHQFDSLYHLKLIDVTIYMYLCSNEDLK